MQQHLIPPRAFYRRPTRGFTLLEVLVALVVLSIGLLGLSGLQTSSLRNNHSAFLRSQATLVTHEIVDRMRANSTSATAGNYDVTTYGSSPPSESCTANCTALQVARMDVLEWLSYVQRLPGGEGRIDVTQIPVVIDSKNVIVSVAEIGVRWADTRDSSNKLELLTRVQL